MVLLNTVAVCFLIQAPKSRSIISSRMFLIIHITLRFYELVSLSLSLFFYSTPLHKLRVLCVFLADQNAVHFYCYYKCPCQQLLFKFLASSCTARAYCTVKRGVTAQVKVEIVLHYLAEKKIKCDYSLHSFCWLAFMLSFNL